MAQAPAPGIDRATGFGGERFPSGTDSASAPGIDSAARIGIGSLRGSTRLAPTQRVDRAAGFTQDAREEIPPSPDQAHVARDGLGRTGWGGEGPRGSEAESEEDQNGNSANDLHHRLLSGGGSSAVFMAAEPDLSGGHRGANRVDRKDPRAKPQH